ncbi:hypothetical protein [Paenibacillus sp. KN14-4R]|uniref:hypothetical protein n=1 Tax=Paenibacillus sp. KN14-4R TaxID=3445773 RepID=UPI003FA0B19E
MRKLRPLPIVISSVCAAAVLFGGWFSYQTLALESPLREIITEQHAVETADIKLTNSSLDLELQLNKEANVREIVQHIYQDGASIIGKRPVNLKVNGHSSPELETWWSNALFDVAGAMENKMYSSIPDSLQKRAAALDGLQVKTEMDDQYMYVTLIWGDASKFILLPRTPAKVGAWPNA